jgi:hypothetical protein
MLALRSGQVQRRVSGPVNLNGHGKGDGEAWLAVTAVPLLDDAGAPQAVVSTVIDATAEHQREIALRRSEEMFRQAMEHTSVGFAILALDGRFLRVNRAMCRVFGYRSDELHQRGLLDLVHPEDRGRRRRDRAAVGRRAAVSWSAAGLGTRHAGVGRAVAQPDPRWAEVPRVFLAQIVDLEIARRTSCSPAWPDPLTGLPNRTLSLDRIQRRGPRPPQRARRRLVCNLDHFKVLATAWGTRLGDAVLVEVSRRLSGRCGQPTRRAA